MEKIEIKIDNQKIEILLKDNNKIVDKTIFPDKHNLSEKLLVEIDKLLRKNGLKPWNINPHTIDSSMYRIDRNSGKYGVGVKEMKVFFDQSDSFTTPRIARSVALAFNWAVSDKEQIALDRF